MVAVIQEKKMDCSFPLYRSELPKIEIFWLKQRAYINCKNNNNGQNMINKYQKCFFGILSKI